MSLDPRTILVTGGTGFIGQALCIRLLQYGFRVYVLTRTKNLSSYNHKTIIYINTLNSLENVEIDIIINLAGENISQRWTSKAKTNIYDSRILTSRHIVQYIKSLSKKPKLLISGSAVGYYGTDLKKLFDEETDIIKNDKEFAQYLCKSWEEEVKSYYPTIFMNDRERA